MMPVTENIKYRHAAHCYLADEDYGKCMAEALMLDFNKVKELSRLSQADLIKATPPGKPRMAS
jgi:catalase